jgi:hypothetical protein
MITTKKLSVTVDAGSFETTIKIDNEAYLSVFVNGYSNWDGKKNLRGFEVTHEDLLDPVFAKVRKEAVGEVAARLARKKFKTFPRNMTFKLTTEAA